MSANELRLDYKDLVAGQLVIVIEGLPTVNRGAYQPSAERQPKSSPVGQRRRRSHRSPTSPLFEEVEAVSEATGYTPALFSPLLLAGWRGKEALTLELSAALIEEETGEDAVRAVAFTEYSKAVLYNGLGRYEHAALAAERVCAQEDLGLHSWARLELVEAGARGDGQEFATDALRHLEERTRADGTDLAQGIWARSAALLSGGDAADALYREAIERFERGEGAVHLSRG